MKNAILYFVKNTVLGVFAVAAFPAGYAVQNAGAYNNGCPWGKQAYCIDPSAKICSSTAKCVDFSAVCFNSWTCNGNFICQSKYNECVNDYNALLRKHRSLQDDYEEIIDCINNNDNQPDIVNCVNWI